MSDINLYEIDKWRNADGKCPHGNAIFCEHCLRNQMVNNLSDKNFPRVKNMRFSKKGGKQGKLPDNL